MTELTKLAKKTKMAKMSKMTKMTKITNSTFTVVFDFFLVIASFFNHDPAVNPKKRRTTRAAHLKSSRERVITRANKLAFVHSRDPISRPYSGQKSRRNTQRSGMSASHLNFQNWYNCSKKIRFKIRKSLLMKAYWIHKRKSPTRCCKFALTADWLELCIWYAVRTHFNNLQFKKPLPIRFIRVY